MGNASCEEEDHVFWNIGFNQYVVYIEDWDFKESHDLCQFRIAVKEEPESAELTLSSVCEEMEEDSDAVTGNDPDTDEQTTDIAYGDVDGDGKLNLTDAVLIMKFMSNKEKYPLTPEEMERADVVDKGESGISGADALAIQMIDANLISADELPISYSELCSRLD